MSNKRKMLIVIPILAFILACQTLTRPVQEVKDVAGTAAAIATQAQDFVTQASGFATEIPSLGTDIPLGNVFDPKSPPLSEWKSIPVMPQAVAGEESQGLYVYKVTMTAKDVEDFYAAQLPSLGWTSEFSMPAAGEIAILMYSKDSQTLSITVTTQTDSVLVMLTLS